MSLAGIRHELITAKSSSWKPGLPWVKERSALARQVIPCPLPALYLETAPKASCALPAYPYPSRVCILDWKTLGREGIKLKVRAYRIPAKGQTRDEPEPRFPPQKEFDSSIPVLFPLDKSLTVSWEEPSKDVLCEFKPHTPF